MYWLGNEPDLIVYFLFLGYFFANSMTASRCPTVFFSSIPSLQPIYPSVLSFFNLLLQQTFLDTWCVLPCITEFLNYPLYLLNQQITHLPFSLNSRLCLAYGGSDVSRCFYWLMQRAGFPYRECQLTNKMDCLLLQHLKETFCHLDQVGAKSKLMIVFVWGGVRLKYLKGN